MSERLAAALVRLHEYRYLTAGQVGKLMGVSRQTACEQLNALVRLGWLGSFGNVGMPKGGKSPVCFYVTKKGYAALQELTDEAPACLPEQTGAGRLGTFVPVSVPISWSPVMAHRVMLTDILIALELGAAKKGITVERMLMEYRRVERRTKEGKVFQTAETTDLVSESPASWRIKPDAAVILRYPDDTTHLYLIEADRGTEPITRREGSSVLGHLTHYDAYIGSERWKKSYGTDSRIVLLVTTTEERMEHIRRAGYECTSRLHKLFLFTTQQEIHRDGFFAKIWKSRDYPDHSKRGLAEKWTTFPHQSSS